MKVALSSAVISEGGVQCRVLVSAVCSRSIAHVSCCSEWTTDIANMVTVSGEKWQCEGTSLVHLQLSSGASPNVRPCVIATEPLGFAFILGMD